MKDISALSRAELAALVVTTLATAGIDVVLVGGSCVCVYTSERFGSFDLDFIDMSYARKREIAAALDKIGFSPRGASKYFERADCQWSIEFPSAPLAIGHEQIPSKRVAELETAIGKVRLLSPTDCIKDRLLWWYLENDGQCWEQAVDVAHNYKVHWADLKVWHEREGYIEAFESFRKAAKE